MGGEKRFKGLAVSKCFPAVSAVGKGSTLAAPVRGFRRARAG